jgi:transcription antitermination factor NusG
MNSNSNRKSRETLAPEFQGVGHKLTDGVRAEDLRRDWYVVRAATRQEKRAEAGLVEAGMAVYVPRLARWQGCGKDRVRVERPLFDGYLFAGLGARHGLYDLTRIDAVHGVVRFSAEAHPRPLAYSQVAVILRQEMAGKFDKTLKIRPLPPAGAPVQITGGQFQGFSATFVQMRTDERVEVLFQMFGGKSTLVLGRDQVRGLGQDDDEV